MKVKILNEEQTLEHKKVNRSIKKEFELLLGKPLVSGSTIHHVDPYVDHRDITNCLCIESDTRDANVVHVILSYCQRHKINNVDTLIRDLNKIPIYQVEPYQGSYIAKNYSLENIVKTIK